MDRVQASKSCALRLKRAVTSVQQQVQRQLWVQSLCNYLALMLGATLLLGFADFLIRSQDPGLRFTSTILFLLAAIWGSTRLLLPTFAYAPTLVDTARLIETRTPLLRNRLSSALAFLDSSQQTTDLQNAVIEETASMLDEINIDTCVDNTKSRRASLTVAAFMLPAMLTCLTHFHTSHLAMKRLLVPWSKAEWPRAHMLQFEDPPQQVAHGQDLELSLIDRNGSLPSQVALQYRYAGDKSAQLRTETLDVKTGPARFQLKNITQPVQFRATGGDDYTMDWSTVRVVEPPRIESFLLRLHPPAYTGWPVQPADRTIRALAGTRIEIGAYSNKPLMNVSLRSAAHDLPFDIWTHLDEERHVFVIPANSELPWTIKQTGTFWFELIDQTDIRGGADTRFSLHAIPDEPPNVTLVTTVKDLRVTALAQLPLQVIIKEDLAVRDIYLQCQSNGNTHSVEKVFLQRSPPQVSADAASRSLANLESGRSSADVRTLSHTLNLASVAQLAAGDTLTCNAIATDYLPQQGQSTAIRLTIISIAELEQLIRLQRTEVLEKLNKALASQRDLHRQLDILKNIFGTSEKKPAANRNELQRIELRQRQIASQLDGNQGSVNTHITTILRHIRVNRLTRPETSERLRQWHTGISTITAENLPAIRTLLLTAIKAAAAKNNRQNTAALLNQAQQHQKAIIQLLTSIRSEFVQRENYLKLSLQLRLIMEQQTALIQAIRQRERTLLENASSSLKYTEREEIYGLSRRQVKIVHRYQRLLVNMEQIYRTSTSAKGSASAALQEALRTARGHGIDTLLLASSDALRQNQLGRSARQQQLALKRIQEVVQLLLQEQTRQLANTPRVHQQFTQQLSQLKEQQKDITNRLGDSSEATLTTLSTSQRILAGSARALGQQIGQSGITEPSATLSRAADQMQAVCDALDLTEKMHAQRTAEKTIQLLQQAETELQQAFQKAPRLAATSWATELHRSLRKSHTKQTEILKQTRRLVSSRAPKHPWSEQQKAMLSTLLRSQRKLLQDTGAEHSSLPLIFSARLKSITNQMTHVAAYFKPTASVYEMQSSEQTQLEILSGLAEMIAAMETGLTATGPSAASNSASTAAAQTRNASQPAHDRRAQLRLLKSWQQAVFEQTAHLASRQRLQGKLTELETQQLKELAATQEQLGALALTLSKHSVPAPKEPASESLDVDDTPSRPQ